MQAGNALVSQGFFYLGGQLRARQFLEEIFVHDDVRTFEQVNVIFGLPVPLEECFLGNMVIAEAINVIGANVILVVRQLQHTIHL